MGFMLFATRVCAYGIPIQALYKAYDEVRRYIKLPNIYMHLELMLMKWFSGSMILNAKSMVLGFFLRIIVYVGG